MAGSQAEQKWWCDRKGLLCFIYTFCGVDVLCVPSSETGLKFAVQVGCVYCSVGVWVYCMDWQLQPSVCSFPPPPLPTIIVLHQHTYQSGEIRAMNRSEPSSLADNNTITVDVSVQRPSSVHQLRLQPKLM